MSLAHGQRTPCDVQAAAREPQYCAREQRPWVLVIAILGSSLAFLEGSMVNLAVPAIQQSFELGAQRVQWVVNAYLLPLSALLLVGGKAGDRFGLKAVFVIGTALFAMAALVAGLAQGFGTLVAARVLQGIGAAMLVPASLALIATFFPPGERGAAIGTWAAASALTTAMGPMLGGWLVALAGWQWVFLFVPPIALATLLLVVLKLPSTQVGKAASLDLPGAVLLALGLALSAYLFLEWDALSWSAPSKTGAVVLAAVLILTFVLWERHTKRPLVPRSLFASPIFTGANLATRRLYMGLNTVLYFLPFLLIHVQGFTATAAGAAFLPFTLVLAFGSRAVGGLADRFGARAMLLAGCALFAVGAMLLRWAGTAADYWGDIMPGLLVMGIGMTLAVAPLTTVVMSAVDDQHHGAASGLNNTAARLAGFIAIALFSAIAVRWFDAALATALYDSVSLSAEQVDVLLAGATQLAQLSVPETWLLEAQQTAQAAIDQAFVDTFQKLMIAAASLAILALATVWYSLPARP